jgi:hypothetical protein
LSFGFGTFLGSVIYLGIVVHKSNKRFLERLKKRKKKKPVKKLNQKPELD